MDGHEATPSCDSCLFTIVLIPCIAVYVSSHVGHVSHAESVQISDLSLQCQCRMTVDLERIMV